MNIRAGVRRVLKVAAALSFITGVIGAASVFVIGADNNPFFPYYAGESSIVGPLDFVVFIALGGIFFGSLLLLTVHNLFTWLSGSDTDPETSERHPENGQVAVEPEEPEDVYLVRFRRSTFYIGLLLALLVGIETGTQMLVDGGASTAVVTTTHGMLAFAVTVLGGRTALSVGVLIFLGAWYGLKREATEALLLGISGWGLIGLAGLGFVTSSASGIGLLFAGAYGVYYGVNAFGATEPVTQFVASRLADGNATDTDASTRSRPDTSDGTARSDGVDQQRGPVDLVRRHEIRSIDDLRSAIDIEPVFVHPRDAENERLTYWSYLSYGLGGLTMFSSLLVGIELWGFPSLGFWGILFGAMYLGHAFGIPQRSSFAHTGGLVWYVFGFLVSLYTVSPLAIVATAGGIYLGWTTLDDVRQPEELVADFRDPSASTVGDEFVDSGLGGGVVLGAVLGGLGAIAFAIISRTAEAIYGLLLILPAVAAGFGVSLGVGERGDVRSGLVAAGLGVGSIMLGFRVLSWLMPQDYQLQDPSPLLLLAPLLGIYMAYRFGKGGAEHVSQPSDGGSARHSTDVPRSQPAAKEPTEESQRKSGTQTETAESGKSKDT